MYKFRGKIFKFRYSTLKKEYKKAVAEVQKTRQVPKAKLAYSFSMPSCNGFYIFSISFIKSLLYVTPYYEDFRYFIFAPF